MASVEKANSNNPPSWDGGSRVKPPGSAILSGEVFDGDGHTTQRGLKSRHAQMIALGGTIGTGLFVGSGQTLARGGPAFIVGCYLIQSIFVYCVVTAIVEVAAYLPTPGSSMNLFAYRYVSKSFGFALGYLYFYSLGILVSYEITAAGLVIEYWNSPVNIGVWITIMMVIVIALNSLPVRFYGETEFWFAATKIIMMLGLLMVSTILFFGGGPSKDRLGFRYWKEPGAANTYKAGGNIGRFIALLSTLVMSSSPFSFAPELLITTGGEMESPRRNLPIAARRYIYRLIIFYMGCVIAISVIVPSDDPRLTAGGKGAGSSPFVIGMKRNGIKALDSVVNGGILVSAWSAANGFFYLSSRSLYALSLQGSAPKIFSRCTKSGIPYTCVIATSMFCFLAYLNLGNSASVVFNWFVNITNTASYISWIACGIVYLRFRKACIAQNITGELPYHSALQPYGTYVILVGCSLLLPLNGFTVFWSDNWSASSFLTSYIGIPVFAVIYFGHRIHTRHEKWAYEPHDVDLYTGMERVLADEKPAKVRKKWVKILTFLWE